MKLSDQEHVKKLTEDFAKAVRAMRALNEHAGELQVGFGSEGLLPGVQSHKVPVGPADREYGQVMMTLRLIARRRVGDLAAELKTLGVDTDA